MSREETFESLRPLMFSIAYRMLGRVGDAEDVVQDAFLRYRRTVEDGVEVESPKAFLSTVVTRLSIDHLRSARSRRESYVGPGSPNRSSRTRGARTRPATRSAPTRCRWRSCSSSSG